MRFKDFIDIDGLKHAKIEEKPVKNYKGDYKALSISKPTSNGSNATYDELKEMQEIFKNRTSEMEKSVEDHDREVGFAIKEYLKLSKNFKRYPDSEGVNLRKALAKKFKLDGLDTILFYLLTIKNLQMLYK